MPLQSKSSWHLAWSDSLSVGIPEIDAEHQHFIQLINKLNEAILERMGMEKIKQNMRAILGDAAAHFAHEEALFREWNYPDSAVHAQKHAQLATALHGIMGRFEHGCTEYELIDDGLKIKSVLIEHLLTEDMKYRDYCQQNKVMTHR